MAKKKSKARNASDSTLRNIRASQARDDHLTARIDALEQRIAAVEALIAPGSTAAERPKESS